MAESKQYDVGDEVIEGEGFRDEIIYTLKRNVAEIVNRDPGPKFLRRCRMTLAYADRFPDGHTFLWDGKNLIMVPRGCCDGGEEGREEEADAVPGGA